MLKNVTATFHRLTDNLVISKRFWLASQRCPASNYVFSHSAKSSFHRSYDLRPTPMKMDSPSSSSRAGNVHDIQFDRLHIVGEDGCSSVLRGTLSGQSVAIKGIEVTRGTDQTTDNELQILQQLNHPNVVKLVNCEHYKKFMFYAFERCDASLAQLFLKSDDPKKYDGPMPHHIDALLQLASGLEHIHSKNLVYGDIQPENVLISVGSRYLYGKYICISRWDNSDAGQDETILKWANVGQTRNVSERGKRKTNQVGGNNAWLAPELQLTRKRERDVEENNCKETAKSDVFALGLVFGSLFLNGEHLYGSLENENEIFQNIIKENPINMQKIDGKLRDCYENELLKKILENDPGKRMTSTQVVSQLKAIKEKLTEKEEELRQLCARDSSSGLIEKINDLIQLGIDVNAKDWHRQNALHCLCENNSNSILIDAIQLLIQLGIDVNAKDWQGQNALHLLCCNNSNSNLLDAIRLFIQLGIDVNVKDKRGGNALHFLCWNNSNSNLLDAIQLLIQLGFDVNAKDNNERNALHYLCWNNSNSNLIDTIRLLIQLGIDVNAKIYDGRNALHLLCENSNNGNLIDAIRLFIQLGIPVVSDGHDAWYILRNNFYIENKDEMLKLLDEAAVV
ncbi:hypothetical protein OUZ56_020383 [Daphnia magna]|uniref:Protein kinase domain-containing protein n=1 Tax=Daphnia magna TaxID=35525 RepID=A0ABQ9ZEC5_9CRUS|nr:hypothetical protein OUZ56_020383 [Daphnia magna]